MTFVAGIVFAIALLGPVAASAQALAGADRFIGNWMGTLSLPTARLRLALTVTREPTGQLTAVMTSVDQGNAVIPSTLTIAGETIVVAMPAAQASYTGMLNASGDTLHGTFSQGTSMPLDMTRIGALPVVMRPQEPTPPYPYRAQDVSFESVPGVRLAGTILRPAGDGPFPAVVLVPGSGPQNRDEELFGHKPFLVIADYLARHGIASLRYDDRGVAKSTGNFAAATSADFADDAESAVRFLRTQAGIAPDRVGLMGHSEGGLIAPMVAARSKEVAFIVLLAGPGIPGDSLLLLQGALIDAAAGVAPDVIKRSVASKTLLFAAIKASRNPADAAERYTDVVKRIVASLPASEQALGTTRFEAGRAQALSPWTRYFIAYDPRPALRQVHVPVLALSGTLDLQVPTKENLSAIDAALKAAGNRDYRTVVMTHLNHLFQAATTGSPTEYASITETFSPAALAIIGEWINEQFGKAR